MKFQYQTISTSFPQKEVEYLINKASVSQGDVICDPFAGAGVVGLVASKYGIRSINIEINKATFKILRQNFKALKLAYQNIPQFKLICGDSETAVTSEKISAIITSPPFTLTKFNNPPQSLEGYRMYILKLGRIFKKFIPLLKNRAKVLVVVGSDSFKGKPIPLDKWLRDEMIKIGYDVISEEVIPNILRKISVLIFSPKTKAKIVDLTKKVIDGQRVWDGFPQVSVKRFQKVNINKGWNGTKVSFPVHELTHIDFPFHAFNNGFKSSFLPVSYFSGTGAVVTSDKKIPDVDFLLFPKKIPVTKELVDKIVLLKKVRFVGTENDTLTPDGSGDGGRTHKELLSRNILIIENLTNLEMLPRNKKIVIEALPLKINADGAPVRVIAKL